MADYRQKLVMKWKSADGWKSTAFCTTQQNPDPGLGALAGVHTAIASMSHAGLLYVERQPVLLINAAPGSGSYASVRDRAQLEFRAADDSTGRIIIPAPVDSIFLAGGERVDFGNASIQALVAAVTGNLCAPSGSPWVTAISGKRTRV